MIIIRKVELNDFYVPFKNGANKGKRIVDIDVGSLEWIVHESGMAQEVKDYADKVLGEKYLEVEEEANNDILNKAPKDVGDMSDNEELPF